MSTIILLEDDPFLRELYSLHLSQAGYTMVSAASGRNIVALLAQHAPALVITDLIMPDHEGMEAIFQIRDHAEVPIIAISVNPDFLRMAAPLVDATLVKPFSGDELTLQVERVLRLADGPVAR